MNRIAEITLDAIQSAAIAGMTMLGEDGQPTTAIYTNPESPEIDAAQYREGKGPCLDAWREKRVFRVGRVEDCEREYPAFAAACMEHGMRSTLSLPMISGDVAVGAMNLYAHVPDDHGPLPGMTADDAFELLRKASQRENVKLRLIARRIVERRPPPSGTGEGPTP